LPDHKALNTKLDINPKAIISPHAGYIYSGPIAGNAFASFQRHADKIRRIILLGPSHYVPFSGLALSTYSAYSTPLGEVPIDTTASSQLTKMKQVCILDEAHEHEHSLEVQLPFLQCILNEFTLVPLVVGSASEEAVAEVIEALWGGDETRIVISSDLSHFLDYNAACQMDKATASAIQALCSEDILDDHACGRYPVKGLLHAARKAHLKCEILDLRNSGDTTGPKSRVVGYGAFAFY
jgi:AmmeMemoRadiSam system protein B